MKNSRLAPGILLVSALTTLEACSFSASTGASAKSSGSASASSKDGTKSEFKTSGSAHFQSKPRASGVGRATKKTDFQGKSLVKVGGKFSLTGSLSGSASGKASGSGSLSGSGSAMGSGGSKGSSGDSKPKEKEPKAPVVETPKPDKPKTEPKPDKPKTEPKPDKPKTEPKPEKPQPTTEPPKKDPPAKDPDLKKDPPKKPTPSVTTPEQEPEPTPEPEPPVDEPEPTEIEPIDPPEEPPPNVFGYAEPVRGCFEGIVYPIRANSQRLPTDFTKLNPISVVYACEWDIPARDWSQGFPGIENKFEWFAIRYSGSFHVSQGGRWKFRISSDDGTKLYIDGKLILNNDGVHPPRVSGAAVELSPGDHDMVLEYFQGPRYLINLQLYATPPGGEEGIFSVR